MNWTFSLRGGDIDSDSDSDIEKNGTTSKNDAADAKAQSGSSSKTVGRKDTTRRNPVSDDAALLRELDISSREETVSYKPNPWSIARVNAATRTKAGAGLRSAPYKNSRNTVDRDSKSEALKKENNTRMANLGTKAAKLASMDLKRPALYNAVVPSKNKQASLAWPSRPQSQLQGPVDRRTSASGAHGTSKTLFGASSRAVVSTTRNNDYRHSTDAISSLRHIDVASNNGHADDADDACSSPSRNHLLHTTAHIPTNIDNMDPSSLPARTAPTMRGTVAYRSQNMVRESRFHCSSPPRPAQSHHTQPPFNSNSFSSPVLPQGRQQPFQTPLRQTRIQFPHMRAPATISSSHKGRSVVRTPWSAPSILDDRLRSIYASASRAHGDYGLTGCADDIQSGRALSSPTHIPIVQETYDQNEGFAAGHTLPVLSTERYARSPKPQSTHTSSQRSSFASLRRNDSLPRHGGAIISELEPCHGPADAHSEAYVHSHSSCGGREYDTSYNELYVLPRETFGDVTADTYEHEVELPRERAATVPKSIFAYELGLSTSNPKPVSHYQPPPLPRSDVHASKPPPIRSFVYEATTAPQPNIRRKIQHPSPPSPISNSPTSNSRDYGTSIRALPSERSPSRLAAKRRWIDDEDEQDVWGTLPGRKKLSSTKENAKGMNVSRKFKLPIASKTVAPGRRDRESRVGDAGANRGREEAMGDHSSSKVSNKNESVDNSTSRERPIWKVTMYLPPPKAVSVSSDRNESGTSINQPSAEDNVPRKLLLNTDVRRGGQTRTSQQPARSVTDWTIKRAGRDVYGNTLNANHLNSEGEQDELSAQSSGEDSRGTSNLNENVYRSDTGAEKQQCSKLCADREEAVHAMYLSIDPQASANRSARSGSSEVLSASLAQAPDSDVITLVDAEEGENAIGCRKHQYSDPLDDCARRGSTRNQSIMNVAQLAYTQLTDKTGRTGHFAADARTYSRNSESHEHSTPTDLDGMNIPDKTTHIDMNTIITSYPRLREAILKRKRAARAVWNELDLPSCGVVFSDEGDCKNLTAEGVVGASTVPNAGSWELGITEWPWKGY